MEKMQSLIQEAHVNTPYINFDPIKMVFEISGECRPENVLTFFNPILDWLTEFRKFVKHDFHTVKELTFHFKLEYYNSSSAKFIFNILKRLKALEEYDLSIKMIWYYDELDEDLLENGQEFEKILNMNFEFIALQD
jgi:hypothetical protein